MRKFLMRFPLFIITGNKHVLSYYLRIHLLRLGKENLVCVSVVTFPTSCLGRLLPNKRKAQIENDLKTTQILDKLLEYKRSCMQHVNRMCRNRLPRVMRH